MKAWSLILVLALCPARAEVPAGLSDRELEAWANQQPKARLPHLVAHLIAKMEEAFQARLGQAKDDAELKDALVKSQQGWLAFADADGLVEALEGRGGSGQSVFAQQRRVYQLRLRIYQLSTPFQQGWVNFP